MTIFKENLTNQLIKKAAIKITNKKILTKNNYI